MLCYFQIPENFENAGMYQFLASDIPEKVEGNTFEIVIRPLLPLTQVKVTDISFDVCAEEAPTPEPEGEFYLKFYFTHKTK